MVTHASPPASLQAPHALLAHLVNLNVLTFLKVRYEPGGEQKARRTLEADWQGQ